MLRLVVASTNPVKLRAAGGGFGRIFPEAAFEIEGVSTPSGVGVQPRSHHETLTGAVNRVRAAAELRPGADFYLGLEGGVEDEGEDMACFAWVAALSRGKIGKACSVIFYLPPAVASLVRQGMELGPADDLVFGQSNSKQNNGAIGLLTGDTLDRAAAYEQAVILSLIRFKNPPLYEQGA
jgi:inosine/xanthosine triphosphatase